ncbi:4369_t:CDS:2 [Dentiscutata erythropus]|uniref:4369_t:CDS:1 n=1 Tax=Dentiscutata erythropus TaxID=1348616 RepID=A0A9N9EP02_9GLOM|nr:4369_t:CDS:2 [Dentiscutata erythropus]
MSTITTKFVTDYKLTTEMNDKEKRRQARNRLIKGYNFSKEQAFALIPLQRVGRCKSQVPLKEGGTEAKEVNICQVSNSTCSRETIKETAQRIMKDKLSKKDIKAISRNLVKTAPDPVVALSRLSRLRRELRAINASEKIVSVILNPEVTRLSNKVQKKHSEQCENEGINFPDHFSLESVKERLNLYDVSNIPDKLALADVMIMLCIRPTEIKNLHISNGAVTGYAKNRAIISGELRDPEKLGSTYLSTFLKKDEFIPKSGKLLLPSSLRKLGAVFASVVHGPKNASKANTYASEALRHSPDNHASPSKRYTIVNMRKRGEPYNQASSFYIFDKN